MLLRHRGHAAQIVEPDRELVPEERRREMLKPARARARARVCCCARVLAAGAAQAPPPAERAYARWKRSARSRAGAAERPDLAASGRAPAMSCTQHCSQKFFCGGLSSMLT